MSEINATDLPAGSVVATDTIAVFRLFDGIGAVWQGTNNKRYNDTDINKLLVGGGCVLRDGYGKGTEI